MQSRRTLQSFASTLVSSPCWHTQGCPFTPSIARTAILGIRHYSDARWTARAVKDSFSKEAKLKGYVSRAVAKIIDIDKKYSIFSPGMTVIDLGYAPGSWTQFAVDRTAPRGRVIGVDLIPAMPPRGASTIQGDFTSPAIQASIRKFLSDPERGRPRRGLVFVDGKAGEDQVDEAEIGYVERERIMSSREGGQKEREAANSVDVVLSDMCEPWPIIDGLWKESLKQPYFYSRLMNVSGIPLRDHMGSMNLCTAALLFSIDVLKPGGSFVCKFYQGPDDGMLEDKLKMVFSSVYRDKPSASRLESRENYFVALRKRSSVDKKQIEEMPSTAEAPGDPFVE